ncbi:MFS transporter [Kineosporia sp. NBRC 101731]|uniref:MFS transporter n=1 Tax=Kineosporia sp. NBRC 101731 TaxID=3032199 RepID=UPI0024A2B979|nr:MFS transporter [Kineosporia sp. NBRC 101731]GLY30267.1 MFS transporter [Kineosporia sp. NBRC 101731]
MTLGTKRATPLYALYAAHTISLTGNMITLISLPLYVLARTGSASATGVAGVVATLPIVLGDLFGGAVVDRLGYRRASILTDVFGGCVIAMVPLLHVSVGVPLWAVFAFAFVGALVDAPGQTARRALLPEVAQEAGVPLERAVGWMEAAERGARLLGAPAAGFLVVALGSLEALFVDTATFIVSALLVARLVTFRQPMVDAHEGAVSSSTNGERPVEEGYWKGLREGLAFLAQDRLLRAIVLLVVVTNLFDAASSTVLLPVYAQRELGGAVALGLLIGAMGGGAMVGSLLFGVIGHRLPRRPTLVIAFTLAGGPVFLALAAGVPFWMLLVVKALAGFSAGAVNPILGTVELERIPPRMRARVFGLVGAGCWAGMPLGSLLAGFAVDHAGLRPTLVFIGVLYIVMTLQPLRGGAWREMDRQASATPQSRPVTGTVEV